MHQQCQPPLREAWRFAKTKQFLLVPGARHGNVSRTAGALYYKAVRSYVDTVCGLNTWRDRRRKVQAQKGGETR